MCEGRTALHYDPSVDAGKAFEALVQLAVLVRLHSVQHHKLVPHHPDPDILQWGAFGATEEFHTLNSVAAIAAIPEEEVKRAFATKGDVMQLVVVPYFASFPLYDFFVLHRNSNGKEWMVAAGHPCNPN
jgi:hypothetical protein